MAMMRSKISDMKRGDSPAVGSSSSSSRGSVISARPIATIWRWPPDSSPAGWRRLSLSGGNSSKASSIRWR
jgi:hypothetical protein